MAAKAIRVGGFTAGSLSGADEFQKFLDGFPRQVIDDTRQELDVGADRLVETLKETAPVSPLEAHPGELRDSVHKESGHHDLSIAVVVDARDEKGHAYPGHVEYGHKTKDGGHVPPQPFFWPGVRDARKGLISSIRSSLKRRARDAS